MTEGADEVEGAAADAAVAAAAESFCDDPSSSIAHTPVPSAS